MTDADDKTSPRASVSNDDDNDTTTAQYRPTTLEGFNDTDTDTDLQLRSRTPLSRRARARRACCAFSRYGGVCTLAVVVTLGVVAALVYASQLRTAAAASSAWLVTGDNLTSSEQVSTWRTLAAQYASARDTSVQPCDDFFQYACGGFVAAQTPLPAGVDELNEFDELRALVMYELRSIAEAGWPLVGTFYESCMDVAARTASSSSTFPPEPLRALYAAAQAVSDNATLGVALASLHAAQVSCGAFVTYVDTDERNTQRNALYISYGELSVSREALVAAANDTYAAQVRAARHAYAHALFTLANNAPDYELALDVEDALATHMLDAAAQRSAQFVATPLDALAGASLLWRAYVDTLALRNASTEVLLAPHALDALADVVRDARHWRAYLLYALLDSYATSMAPAFVEARIVFAEALEGVAVYVEPSAAVNWVQCVSATAQYLGDQMSHYYTDRFFPATSKQDALQIVHQLIASLRARLTALPWMDAPTRQAALVKLAAIVPLIGYPDRWQEELAFAVHADDYLANVHGARAAQWPLMLAALAEPAQRYRWLMEAFMVNAYYQPTDNDVVFPAAILQGTFFVPGAPVAVNYAGFGAVVGHELTHAYDDEGRQYDADGARRDWWTPACASEFEQRAQCVVEQYDAYEAAPGINVDGELTLGENLADAGGVAAALQAMRAVRRERGAHETNELERRIGVLFDRLTSEQLFFVAYANNWCAVSTPQHAYELATVDPHAPARWRVNGVLSQNRDFAAAFGCSIPTPMAPTDVCSVW